MKEINCTLDDDISFFGKEGKKELKESSLIPDMNVTAPLKAMVSDEYKVWKNENKDDIQFTKDLTIHTKRDSRHRSDDQRLDDGSIIQYVLDKLKDYAFSVYNKYNKDPAFRYGFGINTKKLQEYILEKCKAYLDRNKNVFFSEASEKVSNKMSRIDNSFRGLYGYNNRELSEINIAKTVKDLSIKAYNGEFSYDLFDMGRAILVGWFKTTEVGSLKT